MLACPAVRAATHTAGQSSNGAREALIMAIVPTMTVLPGRRCHCSHGSGPKRWCLRRDPDADGAVERRHLSFSSQHGGRQRNVDGRAEVVSPALEDRVGRDPHAQVQVARGRAIAARAIRCLRSGGQLRLPADDACPRGNRESVAPDSATKPMAGTLPAAGCPAGRFEGTEAYRCPDAVMPASAQPRARSGTARRVARMRSLATAARMHPEIASGTQADTKLASLALTLAGDSTIADNGWSGFDVSDKSSLEAHRCTVRGNASAAVKLNFYPTHTFRRKPHRHPATGRRERNSRGGHDRGDHLGGNRPVGRLCAGPRGHDGSGSRPEGARRARSERSRGGHRERGAARALQTARRDALQTLQDHP